MTKKYAFVVGIDSQWITEAKNYFANRKDKLYFGTNAGFSELPFQRVYFKINKTNYASYYAEFIEITRTNPVDFRLPSSASETFKYYYGFRNFRGLKEPIPLAKFIRYSSGEQLRNDFQGNAAVIDPLDQDDIFACDIDETQEKEVVVRKILRDSVIVKDLKNIYNNSCQICNKQINLRASMYSEAHHLQPLGKKKHNGPDIKENLIILCPNHHAEFDFGAIALNPKTLSIEHCNPNDEFMGEKLILKHPIDDKYIEYHYNNIFIKTKTKKLNGPVKTVNVPVYNFTRH